MLSDCKSIFNVLVTINTNYTAGNILIEFHWRFNRWSTYEELVEENRYFKKIHYYTLIIVFIF